MSEAPDPKQLAMRFNECINCHDIDGLGRLMSEDHVFIDSEEELDEGKRSCLENWMGFFQIFPDYKNVVDSIDTDGETVVIEGHTECSDKRLEGPAIWTAKIEDGKIKQWRVYEDTPVNREKLRIKR